MKAGEALKQFDAFMERERLARLTRESYRGWAERYLSFAVNNRGKSVADTIKVSYDTARSGVDRLVELGLVTTSSRPYTGHQMVCTVRGWNLLTEPADFTMFPHSQLALENHAYRKKSRCKETPSENQTPAAAAPGIDVGSGGDDDHPAGAAEESITERADALGGESEDGEAGAGASEADGSERADGTKGPGAE